MRVKIIYLSRLAVFFTALLAFNCRSESHEKEYLLVSANVLKAGALAYEKFTLSLAQKFENLSKNRNSENSNIDTEKFLSKIENYNVAITEDAVSFSFSFSPKGWFGATIYTYDKTRLVFIRETYSK